ncbi:MAG: aspartate aminotransferase family protein [Planctomycetaceae bacterium]
MRHTATGQSHSRGMRLAAAAIRPETVSLNEQLLARAKRSIAGGDSSTMRVLPYHLPLVAERGEGSRVWDAEGVEYLDLNMAFGPLLLGHCPRNVIEAVVGQITHCGSQLGFPTEITVRVAEKVKQLFPSMELLRFANSGTEADMSALRLARAFTGRNKMIQFEGHYHGWSDSLFNRYHAPLEMLSEGPYGPAISGTAGLNGAPRDSLIVQWNDLDALEKCLADHHDEIAAVIMEPVMGNAGVIPPRPGYLQTAREMTQDHGAMLIFDEVITGLRVAPGGAQEFYGVRPDITVISKALGGGYPVAAFGASREIMETIISGKMFHGGVFSGNAVVMAAAEAILDTVLANREDMYRHLHAISDQLAAGLREILSRAGVPHVTQHVGPMISVFLTTGADQPLHNYRDVRRNCEFEKYIRFQHEMQGSGVYFHPNQFEEMFLSAAHTSEDIALALDHFERAVSCLN